MVKLADRDIKKILKAMFQPRHYAAAMNMVRLFNNPVDIFRRYLLGTGTYPYTVSVKTPIGVANLTLYSYHDILTLTEVFCREDYFCKNDARIVVDFGSNIGISALYFLTRNKDIFAYLVEPLAKNNERLQKNLKNFENRFILSPMAVWLYNGQVEFGYEDTGRYGGIHIDSDNKMRVPSISVNNLLSNIFERCDNIDILKIDIETYEKDVLAAVTQKYLSKINTIYVEHTFHENFIQETHNHFQCYNISKFVRK